MAMQPARQYMAIEQYLLLVNNSDRRYEYYLIEWHTQVSLPRLL